MNHSTVINRGLPFVVLASRLVTTNTSALAAFANSAWTAALALMAIPIYLSRLGVEAFGVVGFYIATQALLQIFDLGLAPAVNRELARAKALNQLGPARALLRTLSLIYFLVAAAIAAIFYLAASPIANNWLSGDQLAPGELAQALSLVGLVIAARWPISLYQNALIGLGRLGTASAINAAMSTVTVCSSVAAIFLVAPTLQTLFAAQAAGWFLHALLIRTVAWRALGGASQARLDLRSLRPIWRFSAGMAGVLLTSVGLTQLDKALLSKLLPLASFGEYMLAVAAVGGLAVVITPLFSVIFPRFSTMVAAGDRNGLNELYHNGSRFLAFLYLPLVIALGLYAHDILWAWTGDRDTALRVAPLLTLLCIGWAINGMMYFPYSLQLAHGLSRIPLLINTVLLIALAPLVVLLTERYGARGGASVWPMLQLLYLLLGTYVTHKTVAAGSGPRWVWRSVLLPFVVCFALALALHPLVKLAPAGSLFKLTLVVLTVLATPVICLLASSSLRSIALSRLHTSKTAPV